MSKLPVYVSESDFNTYVLPHLSHKLTHNRLKVSYHYLFNTVLYVLKSGCSWRTLKPENGAVTWQNIYYHYSKWNKDGSFERLFASTHEVMREHLALECIQLDGSHTPAKKGAKKQNIRVERNVKPQII
jgi:transposase